MLPILVSTICVAEKNVVKSTFEALPPFSMYSNCVVLSERGSFKLSAFSVQKCLHIDNWNTSFW